MKMTLIFYPLLVGGERYENKSRPENIWILLSPLAVCSLESCLIFGKFSFSFLTFGYYFSFLLKCVAFFEALTIINSLLLLKSVRERSAWTDIHLSELPTPDSVVITWTECDWHFVSFSVFIKLVHLLWNPFMLHTSTEQPYPSTQHESGVQPRYQPWEQPRYKPCSGLSSTWWVHRRCWLSEQRAPIPAPNACPRHC